MGTDMGTRFAGSGGNVVSIGFATLDVTLSVADVPTVEQSVEADVRRSVGGSATNTALALDSVLDADVYIRTVLGDDSIADEIIERIRPTGIGYRVDDTGSKVVYTVSDGVPRYIVENEGVSVSPDFRPLDWKRTDHIHATTSDPLITSSLAESYATLDETVQPTLSVDITQTWSPGRYEHLLNVSDLLFCNDDELDALRDHYGRRLDEVTDEIIETAGEYPATWYHGDGVFSADTPSVDVVDTTGAGDALTSSVLHALLEGYDRTTALEYGCQRGAETVQQQGPLHDLTPNDE